MRKVKCQNCGKIFETNGKNVKYCSLECRAEGNRQHRRKWESKRPGYNHAYYKRHRHAAQDASKETAAQNDQQGDFSALDKDL